MVIRDGTCWVSSPSGPLTMTRPGSIAMLTPAGTGMGCLPMRLIRSPDEGEDFAADAALRGGPVGDEPGRRGQDRGAHPAEHARQPVLARVHPAAGLGHAAQAVDDSLAASPVLQLDHEMVEGIPALD